MEGMLLDEVHEERHWSVMITKDLKCGKQYVNVVKAANKILGMIKRTSVYTFEEIIVQLYKSLVKSGIEFCIQVWSCHLRKDNELLEKVQRRVTRLIYTKYIT